MRNVKRNKTWQHSGSRMVYGKTRTRQYQKRTLQMAYYSLALFALLIVQTPSFAHNTHAQDSLAQDTVIFHFSPGEKLFRKNYKKIKQPSNSSVCLSASIVKRLKMGTSKCGCSVFATRSAHLISTYKRLGIKAIK